MRQDRIHKNKDKSTAIYDKEIKVSCYKLIKLPLQFTKSQPDNY